MQGAQALEVQIATIHDVDRSGFWNQDVEHVDVVQLAIRDVDEAGNAAAQIEPRVHLDRRLGRAKECPLKYRQAQVDGRRVQGVGGILQFEPQAFAKVEFSGLYNQALRKLGVAQLVGIDQRGSLDLLPEPPCGRAWLTARRGRPRCLCPAGGSPVPGVVLAGHYCSSE